MGFSDIGCYGGEIRTPTLDRLAENGLRLTQFYNTARCCPTRASLLTGLYPHQAGVGHMMVDREVEGYRGNLNRNCVTIAEVLGQAGYRNYMAGKWHVTPFREGDPDGDKSNWPLQRGFDRFYGTIHGAGSLWNPNSLTRDNDRISPAADPEYPLSEQTDGTFFYTDAISDHAAKYIREHQQSSGDQPFFMYVAYTAAHWPMHARDSDIAKYEGVYDDGYDAVRDARYERMVSLGLIHRESTVNWPIPDDWKAKPPEWHWDRRNMQVYAAMVDAMDQGIAKIVDSLEATGELENTLICFLQDNGGCAETIGRRGKSSPRPSGPTLDPLPPEHLELKMIPTQTRDGYPVRTGQGVMAGPADTYVSYGKAWATVSNTPFREYKHYTHEGGISTPLIVHWPSGLERRGEWERTPGHLIDLMATAVDVSGAAYPATFHDGQPIRPLEGVSLQPLFSSQPLPQRQIYWEHEGNRAIRDGKWKLVAKGIRSKWELFDISRDRSEQNDLANVYPEVRESLADDWQAYAERAFVLPMKPR